MNEIPLAVQPVVMRVRRAWKALWPAAPSTDGLRWLYQPGLLNFGYALRTAITSVIALGIALWWQLSSPQWAALTVWMVAQGGRGKSLAKARWHLFGMVVGTICAVALVAATPQQPLLFILLLAAGIGSFCFIGTLLPGPPTMTNYRIHGMRASGFTYAIISLDGVADPNHVFEVAMARATYILLGIVLETTVSSLFQFRLEQRAHERLNHNFITALSQAGHTLGALLGGNLEAFSATRALFSTIADLTDQVEFAEVELGRNRGHEGDHARAAMGWVADLMSRGLAIAALIRSGADPHDADFAPLATRARALMARMADALSVGDGRGILADVGVLRGDCASAIERSFLNEWHHGAVATGVAGPGALDADPVSESAHVNQRMLLSALGEMLAALGEAVTQFQKTQYPIAHDHFHEPIRTFRDWRQAGGNSLRAALTVFGAGVIWIATAWPQGLFFLMFVSIICSLFSTLEQPAVASRGFLIGSLLAAVGGGVLGLWLLAGPSDFELLAYFLGIGTLFGGMAFASPPLALIAVAYNLFLPILIAPSNQTKVDEIIYFNTALPLALGIAYAMVAFRVVLPLDPTALRWSMRAEILRSLRGLARRRHPDAGNDVVARGVDRFVRLLRNGTGAPEPVIDAYLKGILSSMTIALNVRRLRQIMASGALPEHSQQSLVGMMERMAQFSGRFGGHYGRTVRATRQAIAALRYSAAGQTDLHVHMDLNRALSCLTVIACELDLNRAFFDAKRAYLDLGDTATPAA
ncbi:FUSC family protein [Ameyamaea chiangmaiensis]|nr:FUSC family protein [Ameyamaea chiangmaiensis]